MGSLLLLQHLQPRDAALQQAAHVRFPVESHTKTLPTKASMAALFWFFYQQGLFIAVLCGCCPKK